MNKKIVALIVIAGVIFLGTWSFTKAEGQQITICAKKSGLVYVIGEEFRRTDCKKNDALLSWNVNGQQGPKGDTGAVGSIGPQGLKGDKGDVGISAEIPPEIIRPTLTKIVCHFGSDLQFRWELKNSFGSIVSSNSASGISWGTVTVPTNSGLITQSNSQDSSGLGVGFLGWDRKSDIPVPFNFKGGIYWQGFLIPIDSDSVAPADGCVQF